MDNDRRKELKNAYKDRPLVGGVCRVTCSGSGRCWIQPTNDVKSLRNRFEFAVSTKGCPDPAMRCEWEKYGSGSFSFEVLEEL